MIEERIKGYAVFDDNPNKQFCWKIANLCALKGAIFRLFKKGWVIKALYYEKIDTITGEVIENTRLDLTSLTKEYIYSTHGNK